MNELAPLPHDLDAGADRSASRASGLPGRSRLAAFFDSDLLHSFLRSKLVVLAALLTVAMVGAAFLAPLIAPHDPYDLKALSLLDANTPPAWEKGGDRRFLAGHRRPGPRHPLHHSLRHALVHADRHLLGAAGRRHRAVARSVGRLCRRPHRHRDHAHRRRAADVSRHPHRPADRRRGAGDLQELPHRGRQVLDPGAGHRSVVLGAVCPHRAQRDAGGAQQGVRARRPG